MGSRILQIYTNWINKAANLTSASLIEFLEEIGYQEIIWIVLSKKETHLIEYSSDLDLDFIQNFTDRENYQNIKNWVKDTLSDQIHHLGDEDQQLILYLQQDSYENFHVVISQKQAIFIKPHVGRSWTKIAVNHLGLLDKLNTLENALRLGYSIPETKKDDISSIKLNSLKPNFVEDVAPFIFYSVVHESFGPYIYEAPPTTMREVNDYIIVAVKIFSSLDGDMVAEMGHVFTSDPVKKPILGEIFSIIFSLPNQNARGNYEIHSISLSIPNELSNLSKSLIGEFKTKLFMAMEQIRYFHEERDWSIAVDPVNFNVKPATEISGLLERLRKEVALSYALMMTVDDVLNW